MKTWLELSVEVGAMNDLELRELVEKLEFNKRETREEEKMLETAKLEITRRFLGKEKYYIDEHGLLKKKICSYTPYLSSLVKYGY